MIFRFSFKPLLLRKYVIVGKRFSSSSIRIGCASGFWGDTATSVPPLVQKGKLDFLVFDYLSEITMSILAGAKQKSPDMGYTPDFVHFAMAPNLLQIKEQGIKVISNAGGINPHSCAAALKNVASNLGLSFKIAVVTGDDLMPQKDEIEKSGIKEMKSGAAFPKNVTSMNAYLGAGPIAKALKDGADIVITGRCVDSALALGPLISTFDWKLDDWDKLAAGSLVGHLIECGAQSTGGIHTDWHTIPNWHMMGFPIAECFSNGEFLITKPPDTGGAVTVGTVSEQLLYEIGDPANYLLPDVTCDFTNVKMSEVSKDAVKVEGVKGKRPSPQYKVSATYNDGFRATAVCPVVGSQAPKKAIKTAESILKRAEMVLDFVGMEKFRRTHMEVIGAEQNYGPNAALDRDLREVMMWLAVHHDKKEAIGIFAREIAAAATGAAPGFTTLVGGRPKASPMLRLFSFLYPKTNLKIQITMDDKTTDYVAPSTAEVTSSQQSSEQETMNLKNLLSGPHSYRLQELAYTRSGDKGNTCNIGVIARDPSYVPYIASRLTSDVVAKYFKHLFDEGKCIVHRYYLPGLGAFNFLLEDSLGGGGVASLRSDPQGKGCGQVLSDFVLHDMPDLKVIKENFKKN